jgi:hypothetical protein
MTPRIAARLVEVPKIALYRRGMRYKARALKVAVMHGLQ